MATEDMTMSIYLNKPFRLEGSHFKRWKQKMMFFLTVKKLFFVLINIRPTIRENAADAQKDELTKEINSWNETDFVCKNYILNGLCDNLYVYYNMENSAKDLWDALQKKYDTKETGAKKYVVSRYLKYQMVDDKSIEMQSHEIQKIVHEIISNGMTLDEQFQIVVIIDKLPPSWKDFKNNLKHKTKEFSLESLITCLRIEEEARKQDQKIFNHHNQNHNGQQQSQPPKNNSGQFLCYGCGKPGHMARKCRNMPNPTPVQASMIKEPFTAMISEITLLVDQKGGGKILVLRTMFAMIEIGLKHIQRLPMIRKCCWEILTTLRLLEW